MTVLNVTMQFSPNYGNVSEITRNKTHISEVTLWSYQEIPKVLRKTIIKSDKGKLILNNTIDPCDMKRVQKMLSLVQLTVQSTKSVSDILRSWFLECPIVKVSSQKFKKIS